MQRILGLDIGSYSVKAVEILNDFKNYKVERFYEIVVPEIEGIDLGNAQLTAIKQMMTDYNLEFDKMNKVYATVTGLLVSTKFLSFQNTKKKNIAKLLYSELEDSVSFLSDKDKDKYIIDYQIISVKGAVSNVLAVIAKKDNIEGYLSALKDLSYEPTISIEPKVLDVDFLSYVNLSGFLLSENNDNFDEFNINKKRLNRDNNRIIIDIGHEKTSVIYLHGTKIVTARIIRMGGKLFTEYLKQSLNVTFEEAMRIKHAISKINLSSDNNLDLTNKTIVVEKLLGQIVQELVKEILRTILSFTTQDIRKTACINLVGGSSVIVGLREFIESSIQIPVESFKFDDKLVIDNDIAHKVPNFSQTLSIALRGVNPKWQSQINLRRGELALAGDYDSIVNQITNWFLVIIVLFITLGSSYFFRYYSYNKQIDNLKNNYKTQVKALMNNTEPPQLKSISSKFSWDLKEYNDKVIQLINEEVASINSSVDKFTSAENLVSLKYLESISKAIPREYKIADDTGKDVVTKLVVDVTTYEYKSTGILLRGETDSRTSADFIASEIKKVPNLQNLTITSNPKPGAADKIKFEIQIILKEGK